MVAVRFELACAKFLLSRYFDSVACCQNSDSHAAQIAGQRVDAVRFFNAQFGGVAHDQAFITDGPEYCKNWNLINDGSSCRAFDSSPVYARGFNLQISNQLSIRLLDMKQLDGGAHRAQDIQH